MNPEMKKIFGVYVFLGWLIGAGFGIFVGFGSGNLSAGFWSGTLVGVAIGWFAAAAVIKKEKEMEQGNGESK